MPARRNSAVSAQISQIDHYVRWDLSGVLTMPTDSFELSCASVALSLGQDDGHVKLYTRVKVLGYRVTTGRQSRQGAAKEIHAPIWSEDGATLSPMGSLMADLVERSVAATEYGDDVVLDDQWLLDAHSHRSPGLVEGDHTYWVTEEGLVGMGPDDKAPKRVRLEDMGSQAYAGLVLRVTRFMVEGKRDSIG